MGTGLREAGRGVGWGGVGPIWVRGVRCQVGTSKRSCCCGGESAEIEEQERGGWRGGVGWGGMCKTVYGQQPVRGGRGAMGLCEPHFIDEDTELRPWEGLAQGHSGGERQSQAGGESTPLEPQHPGLWSQDTPPPAPAPPPSGRQLALPAATDGRRARKIVSLT